jgi:hypothetical protein
MKTLSSSSFFRAFDLMIGTSNPGMKADTWETGGVRIARERHSYSGHFHCFAIDVFLLMRPGRSGWELIVAKETWWNGGHKSAIKTLRWSHPTAGSRRDILAWFQEQESSAGAPRLTSS